MVSFVRDLTPPLELRAQGGSLRIERDPQGVGGWSRCYLYTAGGESRFLGAERLGAIARRLVDHLATPQSPAGQVGGRSVWWVLSLAEGHHSLYAYIEGTDKALLWQDPNGRHLDAVLRLSEAQYHQWRDLLLPLADGEAQGGAAV